VSIVLGIKCKNSRLRAKRLEGLSRGINNKGKKIEREKKDIHLFHAKNLGGRYS